MITFNGIDLIIISVCLFFATLYGIISLIKFLILHLIKYFKNL